MSAGIQARGLARGYAAGRTLIRQQNEDNSRGEFLRALDASVANCSDFECQFIEGVLRDRETKDAALDFQWFTPGRRGVVDQMLKRYGMRTLRPAPRLKPPQAAPGCCGFLTREEGRRNILCNQPAIIKLNNGLELCAHHDTIRQQEMERLRAFKTRNLRS